MKNEFEGQWEKRWHPLREEWIVYHVRQCGLHAVYENDRVQHFKKYLHTLNEKNSLRQQSSVLKKMGQLMYGSHESYTLCGLGSERTDEIVALAKNEKGVYGAKITGGGNGGTVCLLVDERGRKAAHKIHEAIAKKYNQEIVLFE
jgi:galactokinase